MQKCRTIIFVHMYKTSFFISTSANVFFLFMNNIIEFLSILTARISVEKNVYIHLFFVYFLNLKFFLLFYIVADKIMQCTG